MERWNIGFPKDNSHFNFIVNPAGGGTINSTSHYPLRAVSPTSRRPEPITPLFNCSIIPIVSEANLLVLYIQWSDQSCIQWNVIFLTGEPEKIDAGCLVFIDFTTKVLKEGFIKIEDLGWKDESAM
jgi:hypothetical protein